MRYLFFIVLILFSGCYSPPPAPKKALFKQEQSAINKLNQGYERSAALSKRYSKWYDREEKLPLTIIATAYIDPGVKRTKEYYAYKKLCAYIAKDPQILGDELRKRYSTIKFVDFAKNSSARQKFQTAFSLQKSEKEKLIDVLRPNNEHPSGELLIYLDYDALQNGDLTIRGYKTIKQTNKERNGYFFSLTKRNYGTLDKKGKEKAILHSIQAALKLSIPEYISIDRKDAFSDDKTLRFVVPAKNDLYHAEVWKYDVQDRLDDILDQIREVYLQNFKSFPIYYPDYTIGEIVPDPKNQRYILMASWDHLVRYIDLKNKRVVKTLKAHNAPVNSVAITPDAKVALSGGGDQQLIFWDLLRGKPLKKFDLQSDVEKVIVSDDGSYAAAMCNDGKLYVFDLKSLTKLFGLKVGTGVAEIKFVPNQAKIFVGGWTNRGSLYIVNIDTQTMTTLNNDNEWNSISDMVFLSKEKVAILFSSGKIRFYDLKTQHFSADIIQTGLDLPRYITLSHNKEFLFVIDKYANLQWYDLATKKRIYQKSLDVYDVTSMVFAHGKNLLLVPGFYDGSKGKIEGVDITLDKKAYKKISALKKIKRSILQKEQFLEFQTKQLLLTSTLPQEDIATLKEYGYIDTAKADIVTINDIAYSLGYSYFDPLVGFLYPPYAKKNRFSIQQDEDVVILKKEGEYALDDLYFSSFYDLSNNGYKKMYDATLATIDFRSIELPKEHKFGVNDIAITPNGKYLFSVSDDETMKMWSIANPSESIHTFSFDRNDWSQSVYSVIANDSIVIAGGDKKIKVFDIRTKKLLKTIPLNKDNVSKFALSKDYLAVGLFNGEVMVYGLKNFKKLFSYKLDHMITSLSFSSSQTQLLAIERLKSTTKKNTISLFDIKRKRLLKQIEKKTAFGAISKNYIILAGKSIVLLDRKMEKEIYTFKGNYSSVGGMKLSPNKRFIITSHLYGELRYWDLKKRKELLNVDGFDETVDLSNNNIVVAKDSNGKIKLWNFGYYLLKAKY